MLKPQDHNPVYFSNWHELRSQLFLVTGILRHQINQLLEPFDLTHQQFNALRIIRSHGSLETDKAFSTYHLRKMMMDNNSDTSRLVDRLIQKGLVHKGKCGTDARKVNLCISDDGLKILLEIDSHMQEFDDLLADLMSLPEAKIMTELLGRISTKITEKI
jgi:MarR family transcriptional regulator, 2-MHQ and catechol-resistance regulon repressor